MLRQAQISIIGACNADCLICPRVSDPKARMSDELFHKIINEFREEGLGTLGFGLFEEPLLDPKLPSRLEYARSRLPDTHIVLTTNGQLLAPKMAAAIMPNVNTIAISVHALTEDLYRVLMPPLDQAKVLKNITWLAENKDDSTFVVLTNIALQSNIGECKKLTERFEKYGIVVRSFSCVNRGGLIDSDFDQIARHPITPMRCPPSLLDEALIVDCRGAVLLCCQDFKSEYPIGDLSQNSLKEVLRDPRRLETRKAFAEDRYSELPMCKLCRAGASPAGQQGSRDKA